MKVIKQSYWGEKIHLQKKSMQFNASLGFISEFYKIKSSPTVLAAVTPGPLAQVCENACLYLWEIYVLSFK